MKIGVISDSHDNIANLTKALDIFKREKAEALIHCGDLCSPFMIREMVKFNGKIYFIAGNVCDAASSAELAINNNMNFIRDYLDLEIDNKKIAVVHFPFLAESLALSGKYDAVFYGHNHKAKQEKKGKTLLINPGELMGKNETPCCAIYDTKENLVIHIKLK